MADGETPTGSGTDLVGKVVEQPAGSADPALTAAYKLAPTPTDASSLLNTASETGVKIDFVPTDPTGIVGKWGDLTADSNKLAPSPTDATSLAGKISAPADTSSLLSTTSETTARTDNKLTAPPTETSSLAGKVSAPYDPSSGATSTFIRKDGSVPTDPSSVIGPAGSFQGDAESAIKLSPVPTDASGLAGKIGGLEAPTDAGLNAGLNSGLNAGLNAGLNSGLNAGLNAAPDPVPDPSLHVFAGMTVGSDPALQGILDPAAGTGGGSPGGATGSSLIQPIAAPQSFAAGSVRGATGAAHIHGYIAFVDPSTNAEYLPHQANGLGTSIAPGAISLRFQHITGATMNVNVGGGAYWYREAVRQVDGSIATRAANSGGIAWYYAIQLNLDDSDDDPRVDLTFDAAAGPALAAVVYNPQRWQFLDAVSVGFAVGVGTGAGQLFTRRATPFSDLPDPR